MPRISQGAAAMRVFSTLIKRLLKHDHDWSGLKMQVVAVQASTRHLIQSCIARRVLLVLLLAHSLVGGETSPAATACHVVYS